MAVAAGKAPYSVSGQLLPCKGFQPLYNFEFIGLHQPLEFLKFPSKIMLNLTLAHLIF